VKILAEKRGKTDKDNDQYGRCLNPEAPVFVLLFEHEKQKKIDSSKKSEIQSIVSISQDLENIKKREEKKIFECFALKKFVEEKESKRNSSSRNDLEMEKMGEHERRKTVYEAS
jgi:hypothetical protein